jgi:co-chaperonin GroES (HSP10)
MSQLKIQPLNKQVLVLIERKKEKTKSGIIIASADDPRSEKAKVLALDKEVKCVKRGDIIYFKSYTLSEMEIDDKLYGFIKEDEILAKDA